MCDEGFAENAHTHERTHTHKAKDRERGKLALKLRPAVLSGCVWCLMRQRDVKTDSHNETADGHAAEKHTHANCAHRGAEKRSNSAETLGKRKV